MRIEVLPCMKCRRRCLHRYLNPDQVELIFPPGESPADVPPNMDVALVVCFSCRHFFWHLVTEAGIEPGFADVYIPFPKESR